MGSLGDALTMELFPAPCDPVMIELNRLENGLLEKERELGLAKCEIKTLKATELSKDKAVMELSNEVKKMDEKLRTTEKQLENKNLEIKKLINEKKEALAAQFSAEAALRRVHATQKDEELVPVGVLTAPLESDIRQYKSEIVMLQEDNKALERLTKSKEAALVEAEALLQSALEQAMSVEMVRNKNLELKRQMEICQEENRTLEKTYRQKVIEVERLTKTITELEESILASGATANAISDYQRQISELNEGKRMVERELARVKVSASRMATVAANEWKDDNDKVIPVKQWLEERRFLQGEIQRLRDKLALAERTAKAESHLKDKLSLRLKTIEECLKPSSLPERHSEVSGGKKSGVKKRSASRPRASHATKNASVLQQPHSISGNGDKIFDGKNPVQKNLSAPRGRSFSDSEKENAETNVKPNGHVDDDVVAGKTELTHEVNAKECGHIKSEVKRLGVDCEDMVSGFLYDRLQKEVLNLKGSQKDKESLLSAKDDEIKMLQKKVDVLTRAVEMELKKTRRNAVAGGERKMLAKPADNKHHTDISERHVRQLEASEGSTA
ncbi:hypothetical protein OPV22_033557 [Ensete ventricosum]|uniref:Uncharacterized protein n=1 Tax=Ensete ventricosum TaxID=4639 RepID=A0AAV8P0Z7_ENSVE|nr:hypothetical protein OPV22_033557 [Ensete ventricosum]